jgi:2'-5' RNA ligase
VRAFLAIPLLPPALEDFEDLRERLVGSVPSTRWAPAESPHITLHFFGAVSSDDAERALATLRPVLRARSPMRLRLHGLGSFPAAGLAHVLWCGVGGDVNALNSCARGCMDALEAAGFPVEHRPHRAHCTLGRPRHPWPAEAREAWKQHVRDEPRTAIFTADRALLFESVRAAAGVRHFPREMLPLGPVETLSPPLRADAVRDPRCGFGTARELR